MLYTADVFLPPPVSNIPPCRAHSRRTKGTCHSQEAALSPVFFCARNHRRPSVNPDRRPQRYTHLLPMQYLIDKVQAGVALHLAICLASNPIHAVICEEVARPTWMRTHTTPLYERPLAQCARAHTRPRYMTWSTTFASMGSALPCYRSNRPLLDCHPYYEI